MGFVEKRVRGSGDDEIVTWRARYRGPDGRERNRSFDRKVDADRFLTTVEADMLRGE